MNQNANHHLLRVGFVLTFLAAGFVGWQLAPAPEPAAETAGEAPGTSRSSRPVRVHLPRGIPAGARSQLASLRAIESPQERLQATIQLVNSLPPSALYDWLEGRWFDIEGSFDLTIFNKIAQERLRAEDPKLFLKWRLGEGSASEDLIREMAGSDPDYLVEIARGIDFNWQTVQTFSSLARSHPEVALRVLREMDGAMSGDGMMEHYRRQLLSQIAQASPAALEAVLGELSSADRKAAERLIVGERLKTSFDTEIRKLWDDPDGWLVVREALNSSEQAALAGKLIGVLHELPPAWKRQLASMSYAFVNEQNARDWLKWDLEASGFSKGEANNFKYQAILQIGRASPEEALRAVADLSLDETVRQNVIRNIFSMRTYEKDQADALLRLVSSEADREAVREILARQEVAVSVSRQEISTPSEWIEAVGKLPDNDILHSAHIMRNWGPEAVEELAKSFRELPPDAKQKVAMNLAGESPSRELRAESVRYLVENPPAEDGPRRFDPISRASTLATQWAAEDPAAASQWVRSLPAGDARIWAQKNLAAVWAEYDPEEAGRWVGSLPAAERKEVQDFMKSPGMR